jgi:chitin disaccharide deacetylase
LGCRLGLAGPLFIIPAIEAAATPPRDPASDSARVDTLDRVKRLIVNADDFGLTAGVNRAIVELNRGGSLTSATLMAMAKSAPDAVSLVRNLPRLGVGCHIVLVDGKSVLPASELPTLVNRATGRFRPTLGKFVRDLFLGRIRPAEIEIEAEAQIARLQAWGLSLTHVDTHKHTHMFPGVLGPVLAAAAKRRIRAIRNPFEPSWSLAATQDAPALRRTQVHILNRFQPAFRRLVDDVGLVTTDGAIGVLATGTLDAETLASLLRAMPDGTWELVTHPGYNDSDLAQAGTRLLASREVEQAALTAASFPADIELIHFGHLATHGNP